MGRDEGSEEAVVGGTPGFCNVQTDTPKVEVENLVEPQIVLENSPVGESQANGRVEGVIDRVKSQVRALKLDIETNYNHG